MNEKISVILVKINFLTVIILLAIEIELVTSSNWLRSTQSGYIDMCPLCRNIEYCMLHTAASNEENQTTNSKKHKTEIISICWTKLSSFV